MTSGRENIAFHLLIDIGNFYSKDSINAVRYSNETLEFWLIDQKLLKGKGVNFFRSFKAQAHLSVRIVVSVWNLQQSVLTFSFLLNEIFFFLAIYIAYITFSVVFLQFNNFYGGFHKCYF
jgi:hypothetical protein